MSFFADMGHPANAANAVSSSTESTMLCSAPVYKSRSAHEIDQLVKQTIIGHSSTSGTPGPVDVLPNTDSGEFRGEGLDRGKTTPAGLHSIVENEPLVIGRLICINLGDFY